MSHTLDSRVIYRSDPVSCIKSYDLVFSTAWPRPANQTFEQKLNGGGGNIDHVIANLESVISALHRFGMGRVFRQMARD